MDLQKLAPGWDGDDAPAPSQSSIAKASKLLEWLRQNDMHIESIDPDVLGGVDIYLNGAAGTTAWVAILNAGEQSIVFSQHGKAIGHKLDNTSLERMKSFLGGERGSIH